ncbi:MAG: FtsX-like permease family protein [Clostridiales bacterium]|nr:FtsX-like permease family protein [Clostridiales bacterium]
MKKTGFAVRWNIRNFRSAKIRALMGAVGTIGCMVLLVCAFCCFDSVSDMEVWMYDEIQVCNTRFVLKEDASLEQAQKIALDVDGELIETQTIEVQANGEKVTATLTACEGKGLYNITDVQRNISAPTEGTVALSQKVADELGVKAGDTIKWHIYTSNNWAESEVTIINRVPVSQGMVVSYDVLEASGYDFEPNYVDTMEDIAQYDSNAVANIITAADMTDFWSAYTESMNMLVAVLIVFAVLLVIVVLYNMGSLTFTEKQRELVTLKVIGFQNPMLLSLMLLQNFILSVIGVVLGAPFGKYLVKIMLDSSGSEFDMEPILTLPSFLISAVITLGVSLLVTLLFIKKLGWLDPIAELKGTK